MSSPPKTLVTAATGKTGQQVTQQLLDRGLPVRALVHRDDDRAARLRAAGADTVVGNLSDVRDVRRALDGVQRAYWAAPIVPGALEAATIFATVAEEQRLEVVVAMSQWLADPGHPSAHTRAEWLADHVFSWMPDVGSITVNPGLFAENYLYSLDAVAQFGVLTLPFGEGLNAPPSNEDIAAVATALLADPEPHLGRTYRPTGPELVSAPDVAEVMGRVLGRRIRYAEVPFALMAKSAKAIGFDAYTVIQLRWYVEELRRGTFAVGAPTDAVGALTGREAEDMETIVRRYLQTTPGTTRGLSGMARAMRILARTTVTPAPRMGAYLREHQGGAELGALAADSPEWHAEHDPAATPALSVR